MNVRTLRRGVLVLAGAATLALAPATVAQAGPEKAPPAPSDGIVMVNGAGKTVTVPRTVLAQGKSSFAGSSGNGLAGKPADKTKPGGGGFSTDSVIGTDDRVQESDPYGYPWRAIAHLSTNQGGCTGFMLSRDVLVTAGHCVYHGGWVTSYRVVPGKNGGAEPYGSCSGGIADVWTTYNYISTGSADYDYGLIKLTCDIGNTVGWFGWWYNTGENLVNQYFYVEGYPGDKPYGTNWWDGDYATQQTASRLFYWNDTAPGQSGSPIYHYNSVTPGLCGGWCVTGIHTTGVWDTAYNSGTRFNPDVMSFINYWVSQP